MLCLQCKIPKDGKTRTSQCNSPKSAIFNENHAFQAPKPQFSLYQGDPQSLKALYISTIYMGVCSGFFLLLKKNTFFDTIFAIQSFRNMFKKAITLLAKKWHF